MTRLPPVSGRCSASASLWGTDLACRYPLDGGRDAWRGVLFRTATSGFQSCDPLFIMVDRRPQQSPALPRRPR